MIDADGVVAVVLAAGLSRRFGPADKLMAIYRGQPLVSHAGRLLLSLPFQARLAVTQPGSEVACLMGELGLDIRFNMQPRAGIGGSLAIAVQAADAMDASACLVLLGDMPNVTAVHLRRLLDMYAPPDDRVVSGGSQYRSPPALFGRRYFAELSKLMGDHGGVDLMQTAPIVFTDRSVLTDVDTQSDLFAE